MSAINRAPALVRRASPVVNCPTCRIRGAWPVRISERPSAVFFLLLVIASRIVQSNLKPWDSHNVSALERSLSRRYLVTKPSFVYWTLTERDMVVFISRNRQLGTIASTFSI